MSTPLDPNGKSQVPSTIASSNEESEEERRRTHTHPKHKKQKKKSRIGKVGSMVKAPFRRISNDNNNNKYTPFSTVSSSSRTSGYPHYYGERPLPRCYYCCSRPLVEDAAADSPVGPETDNPSNFDVSSYGFVKNLIERSDFYGADCNVHRDG